MTHPHFELVYNIVILFLFCSQKRTGAFLLPASFSLCLQRTFFAVSPYLAGVCGTCCKLVRLWIVHVRHTAVMHWRGKQRLPVAHGRGPLARARGKLSVVGIGYQSKRGGKKIISRTSIYNPRWGLEEQKKRGVGKKV